MDVPTENPAANSEQTALSSLIAQVRSTLKHPGTYYKVPLAELVSKVVVSNSQEFERIKAGVRNDFQLGEELSGALRVEDWEKALNDEANFQFSSKHRPLVEGVLNGIDTQLRYEAKTGIPIPDKKVKIDMRADGFTITDSGGGMNIEAILTKLLVPKLTGNMVHETEVIGRFGVGFYSLLGYIKDKNDNVVVRTVSDGEAYRISISRYFGKDQSQTGKLSIAISRLPSKDLEDIKQGTQVEVNGSSFDEAGATHYLTDTLKFKSGAQLLVNNQMINDISNYDITESKAVPGRRERAKSIRLIESKEKSNKATVMLAVGGVKVEQFEVEGTNLSKELVLDLPSDTPLPKSRDKVEINATTVDAFKRIFNTILQGTDFERSAALANTIAPVVGIAQRRNPNAIRDANIDFAYKDGLRSWAKKLPADRHLVPALNAYKMLDLTGAIYLDSVYFPGRFELTGYEPDANFHSPDEKLYWVPFKDKNEVITAVNGKVFINERFKTSDPRRLGMLNALISTYSKTSGERSSIKGNFELPDIKPSKAETSPSPAEPEKTTLPESASEMEQYCERLKPEIKGRLVYETVERTETKEVPLTDEEYAQELRRATENIVMPKRSLSESLLDRIDPRRLELIRRDIEERKTRAIERIDRTKIVTEKIAEEMLARTDYTPENVSQLRHWWIMNQISYTVLDFAQETDEKYSYKFKIFDSPQFWQEVLDDKFLSDIESYVSTDLSVSMERGIRALPDKIRQAFLDDMDGQGLLDNLSSEPDSSYTSPLLNSIKKIYSDQLTQAEKVQYAQALIVLVTAQEMRDVAGVFHDDQYLQHFCAGGQFADLIQLTLGLYSWEGDRERFDNFSRVYSFNTTGHGLMGHELSVVQELKSTEERTKYTDWYLRNKENIKGLSNDTNGFYISPEGKIRHGSLEYKEVKNGEERTVLSDHLPEDTKCYIDAYTDFYRDLYFYGIDSPEKWQMVRENLTLLKGFTKDQQLRELFFGKPHGEQNYISSPHWSYLLAHPIDRGKIPQIIEYASQAEFADNEARQVYAVKALAYSYLPDITFQPLNDLLYRIATEQNAAVSSFISENNFSYHETDQFRLSSDGWVSTPGNIWDSHYYQTSLKGKYRLSLDTEDVLQKRIAFLNTLPAEYACVYYRLQDMLVNINPSLPVEQQKEHYAEIEERLIATFRKIAEQPQGKAWQILIALARESEDSKTNIVKRLSEFGRVEKDARLWLRMLVEDKAELPVRPITNFFDGVDNLKYLKGSELVARYFTTSGLEQIDDLDKLESEVKSVADREQAVRVGQRRIEHAANYQSTEGYVWLRELIQNGFNATRGIKGEKKMEIENYLTSNDFVISVNDPLGMSLGRVINALLVPQKSEWSAKDSLGYFGHGFFTVFKEADEVRVKTSTGEGKTLYVSIRPDRDYGSSVVEDLNIAIGVKDEVFKGSSIQWIKGTQFHEFEAARAKNDVVTYAGLVPSKDLVINWNGEQINKDPPQLSQVDTPMGPVKFYLNAGENIVSQNGLYIKEMDSDYKSKIPETLRNLLTVQGVSLDLPAQIHLIDSRADIANKEDVLAGLSPHITEAALRGAISLFAEGKIVFDRLPYDFIKHVNRYVGKIDEGIRADAKVIAERGATPDYSSYIADSERTLQLLLSIPAFEIEDVKYSVFDAVIKAKADLTFARKLPEGLRKMIMSELVGDEIVKSGTKQRFAAEGLTAINDFDTSKIPAEYDAYHAWQAMLRAYLQPVADSTHLDYLDSYYSKDENTLAHYVPFLKLIGWNLFSDVQTYIETLSQMLKDEAVGDQQILKMYEHLFETGSHEWRHREENLGNVFTHEKGFFQGQKGVLAQMIEKADAQVVERDLKAQYRGGFIPANQLTAIMSHQLT